MSLLGAIDSRFSEERWGKPQAPVAAITLISLLYDQLQRFHTRNFHSVAGYGRPPNDAGTKCLLAVGFDHKNYRAVGLVRRVQAGFTPQLLPLAPQVVHIPMKMVLCLPKDMSRNSARI